ncbi:MAG: aminopeptidase P family protein, partial [Deltaproteobacteria bacterium]|nr:aminopeptidase P family protein [Deltaproteobacteria bacterium]
MTNGFETTRSLGFHYTPEDEIRRRISMLKAGMEKNGIDAALIVQKMDFFYFTGTTQNGCLFIPVEGEPLLFIRRERERALIETPLETVADMKRTRDLRRCIKKHLGKIPETLGLEMDVLPVKDYFKYRDLFPEARIMDMAGVIRDLRKIKSPFEAGLMRKAGEIGRQVYREAGTFLRRGMSEIEFAGLMEATAKKYGHEGLLRVRDMNYEAYTWHVLSGPNGGIVSQSDSPMGGLGLSPAFPVGASLRPMRVREPILVDFGICYHGYQIDETRMFSIGKMKDKFIDAYRACVEIHDALLEEIRQGADCEN